MNELKLGKNVLILSIMTLITVITWIVFEVYRTATKTTIPQITQEQMMTLNPQIKKETIEELKGKIWISEEELNSFNFPVASESTQEK